MKNLTRKYFVTMLVFVFSTIQVSGQFKKKKKKDIYKCGYVHKKTLKEKMNPMAILQKGMANALTNGKNNDLGKTAITIGYQAHLHPVNIVRYITKTPGYETCGDAIYAVFTNRNGPGISSTDGKFSIDGKKFETVGIGSYFYGFKPESRGEKVVKITSSDGDELSVKIKPTLPLEIMSIDGKPKGSEIEIDGSKDIVIMLNGGDLDPKSKIHVQLVSKMVGTPVIMDLVVVGARNKILIPKEAFKNYEGSPAPLYKKNTLVVNRVVETLIEGTDAGAIRTVSGFMDFAPVTLSGSIVKGSVMTSGFNKSKNTFIKTDTTTAGDYKFIFSKDGPFKSPPTKHVKKVAIASFIIRGNLQGEETDVSSHTTYGYYVNVKTTTTTIKKKSVSIGGKSNWGIFADNFYAKFAEKLTSDLSWEITPLEKVLNSKSYAYIKPIKDTVTKSFAEVGAGNTKRLLTTSSADFWKDMSITFGSDFVGNRLINELGVDAVLGITVDLNINMKTGALDPKMRIVVFGPAISYRTNSRFFSMDAFTQSLTVKDAKKLGSSAPDQLFSMIKGDVFCKDFVAAVKKLKVEEEKIEAYNILYDARK